MDESAIRDEIGIKNSADRAKIVGSLVLLRAKAAAGPSEYLSAVSKRAEVVGYVRNPP